MLYLGRPRINSWEATVFAPPREVFAVAEQVLGLPPFTFNAVDETTAEVVQTLANGFFGQWTRVKYPKNRIRIECHPTKAGTQLRILAQGQRSSTMRAVNLLRILTHGERDSASTYRYRAVRPGPCTVVQSWAGTGYPLFVAPDHGAERGRAVRPATPLVALEQSARWVRVRAGQGDDTEEGWIEADQLVSDPTPARLGSSA
ncbi:MAG: hypothetical protein ACREOD_02320 [Candidatus Dormibacteria bacterium]